MSQGHLGLSDRSHDPFMTSITPEDGLTCDETPWGSTVTPVERNSAYSGTMVDVLDDVEVGLKESLLPLEPSVPTETPASGFTDCFFDFDSDGDVTPLSLCLPEAPPNTPQAGSLLLQQPDTTSDQHASRPTFSFSALPATITLSSQPLVSQEPSHRYSLSDSDAAQPTLLLLQSPLSQTSGPVDESVYIEKQIQGGKRSASNVKSMKRSIPTSMPTAMKREISRVTSAYMTPPTSEETTPVGTPSVMPTSMPRSETTPAFMHMSMQEKMRESPRVIAIGAMQVFSKRAGFSPSNIGEEEDHNGHTKLAKLVDEIEGRIQDEFGFDAKAQTGVEMIREVLVEKTPDLEMTISSDDVFVSGIESDDLHRYVALSEIFPLEVAMDDETIEDDLLKLFTMEHAEGASVAAEELDDD